MLTRYTVFLFCAVTLFASCRKFVTVPPPIDQTVSRNLFTTDAGATAAINGIYSEMMSSVTQFSSAYTTIYAGFAADELYSKVASSRDEFALNNITPANHSNLSAYFWQPAYRLIYAANSILEQLDRSSDISPSVRNSVEGEARFVRAFCYFQLVNLFGDVPLVLTTDYKVNSFLPRQRTDSIYRQMASDLVRAEAILGITYLSNDRGRPNRWAATALLSRVYLYQKEWAKAEAAAHAVISSGAFTLPALANVFLKTSTETIWQLAPVRANFNTTEGNLFVPVTATSTPAYLLTPSLLNAFETGDNRRSAWTGKNVVSGVDNVYPAKYKVRSNATITEHYVVLRLAEQYLIRAEARAQQGLLPTAMADLNFLRTRAGLAAVNFTTQATILAAVERERRIELFAEWGHRWMDLKRTDRATPVLGALKPATWQDTDILWPIPQDQINLNSNLTQNPGY